MVLAVTVFACEGSDSAEVKEATVRAASKIDFTCLGEVSIRTLRD